MEQPDLHFWSASLHSACAEPKERRKPRMRVAIWHLRSSCHWQLLWQKGASQDGVPLLLGMPTGSQPFLRNPQTVITFWFFLARVSWIKIVAQAAEASRTDTGCPSATACHATNASGRNWAARLMRPVRVYQKQARPLACRLRNRTHAVHKLGRSALPAQGLAKGDQNLTRRAAKPMRTLISGPAPAKPEVIWLPMQKKEHVMANNIMS